MVSYCYRNINIHSMTTDKNLITSIVKFSSFYFFLFFFCFISEIIIRVSSVLPDEVFYN